uniref:uncharacterized protein n=1 Tax=Semicossyphus pulcher TaxID=241346 RepID=UPI0037E707F7
MNGSQYIWILNGMSLMLTSGGLAGVLLQNVALKQNAVQSSSAPLGPAENAVDGKRNPSFAQGSCSLTKEESNPWWRVDLQNVYKVTAVMITNRNEQENKLNGAEIWIGTSLETNNATNFRCGVICHIPKGHTFFISCSSIEGRYVTVLLHGTERVLSLCEVEVYPSDSNLALRGEATQSSTSFSGDASRAIDGRRNSFFEHGSCSQTKMDEADPWWRLDLLITYAIATVKVTNRGDCCAESLDGAEIRIGNSLENNGNNNPRCASISHIRAGKTYTYHCEGGSTEGRFVNVIIPGSSRCLTLCEVEVYAAPEVEPLANVALDGKAVQSSTVYWTASVAINGDRNGVFTKESCTHTASQSSPWWRVDLLAVHRIRAVAIFNREDCCPDRLIGAQILIGNSQLYDSKENSRCGIISSVAGTSSHTFLCGDMEGRYVFVVIEGQNKFLTLCEVEVYASLPAAPEATTLAPPTESVLLSGRTVTVVGERLCWSDALFYCRRHHWDLLSLRSQEEQSEVEQLLTRSPFPLTDFVWLGLRRKIMEDRWFWMSGESMTFTKWSDKLTPEHANHPCGGIDGGEHFLWKDQPCQEHLNFICQSGAGDGAEKVYFYSSRQDTSSL